LELFKLMKNIEFSDGEHGHAQVLYADASSRALRFSLKKGQKIDNFLSHSPVHVMVLKGSGIFEGKNGYQTVTHSTLIHFAEDEEFSVKAENEDLVFIAVMHGSTRVDPDHAPVRG
jgi:quercetin dioxygenase-like cupin family protein